MPVLRPPIIEFAVADERLRMLVLGTYLRRVLRIEEVLLAQILGGLAGAVAGQCRRLRPRTPLPLTSTGASCCSVATPWACGVHEGGRGELAPRHHGLAGKEKLVMILL